MIFAALNTEVMKYVLMVGTFPLWLPFLKALYTELDDALASEGGLLGRPPTRRELKVIEANPNRSKSPLVSFDRDPGDKTPRDAGPTKSRAAERNVAAPQSRGASGFSKPRGAHGFARKDQRGG